MTQSNVTIHFSQNLKQEGANRTKIEYYTSVCATIWLSQNSPNLPERDSNLKKININFSCNSRQKGDRTKFEVSKLYLNVHNNFTVTCNSSFYLPHKTNQSNYTHTRTLPITSRTNSPYVLMTPSHVDPRYVVGNSLNDLITLTVRHGLFEPSIFILFSKRVLLLGIEAATTGYLFLEPEFVH